MTPEEKAAAEKAAVEKTEEKVEETKIQEDADFLLPDGRKVKLSAEEKQFLMTKGLEALEADKTKAKSGEEKEKAGEIKEIQSDKTLTAEEKIDRLTKLVEDDREERKKEKKDAEISSARSQLTTELNTLITSNELTKEDSDVANTVKDLVLQDLLMNPRLSPKAAFEKRMETFDKIVTKNRKEYIDKKKSDKEKTKGAGSGGAAPGQEKKKFTGADLMSGKIRKHVGDKIREERRKLFR